MNTQTTAKKHLDALPLDLQYKIRGHASRIPTAPKQIHEHPQTKSIINFWRHATLNYKQTKTQFSFFGSRRIYAWALERMRSNVPRLGIYAEENIYRRVAPFQFFAYGINPDPRPMAFPVSGDYRVNLDFTDMAYADASLVSPGAYTLYLQYNLNVYLDSPVKKNAFVQMMSKLQDQEHMMTLFLSIFQGWMTFLKKMKNQDDIYAPVSRIIHKLSDKNTKIMIRVDTNAMNKYFDTDHYKKQTRVVRTNVQKKMDDNVTKSFNAARRVFQKFPSVVHKN